MSIHNLPQHTTTFIGRTGELSDIADRLADPNCRLLTLVGPGGIGKTRLAIETASHPALNVAAGVYFVGLQPVTSVDHVLHTIASGIGFEFDSDSNLITHLSDYLHDKSLLLILDNFEHLLAASDQIADLLSAAPQLKILVTSREALNLVGEWLFHVDGMGYPADEPTEALDTYSAVNLFAERARRVRYDFSLADEAANVLRVCRLVEGIPLGIELAATWLRRLPCAQIADEIQNGLDILKTDQRGVPDRHRSMRVVFEHSWRLLSDDECEVLMGLSVFRGGFLREAAEQVAGASLNTLSALVDKSLLQMNSDGRYAIHELQRQYAAAQLSEKPEHEIEIRDRHCEYFCEFMDIPLVKLLDKNSRETVTSIEHDIDNVRAAWYWGIQREKFNNLYRAMESVYWFSWLRAWHQEGERAFNDALVALRVADSSDEHDLVLSYTLKCLGLIDIWQVRLQRARERLEESVAIVRQLNAPHDLASAIGALGWAILSDNDPKTARPILVEAEIMLEETGQHAYHGFICGLLGAIARTLGEYEEIEHWYQKALNVGRQIGDQRTIAEVLGKLGIIAFTQGEYGKAHGFFAESMVVSKSADIPAFLIGALNWMGQVAEAKGNIETANHYFEESMAAAEEWGKAPSIARTLIWLAQIECTRAFYEIALARYQQAMEIVLDIKSRPLQADALAGLGRLNMRTGDFDSAQQRYEASLSIRRDLNDPLTIADSHNALGRIATMQGNSVRARQHFYEALQIGITTGAPPVLLKSIIGVAELLIRESTVVYTVRLGSLVFNHPASHAETKGLAENLLQQLENALPDDEYATAYNQGAHFDLETIAENLKEALTPPKELLAEPLTERELEVLRLVAAGRSNREIAHDLIVAKGTVASHLHHIFQKLDVRNRTQAVALARDLYLL